VTDVKPKRDLGVTDVKPKRDLGDIGKTDIEPRCSLGITIGITEVSPEASYPMDIIIRSSPLVRPKTDLMHHCTTFRSVLGLTYVLPMYHHRFCSL